MILSHQHAFVFMKTRKTAGTSVEIALSRVCGPDDVITPVLEEDLRADLGGRGPQNFEAPPLEHKAFNHMPVSMVRRLVGKKRFESYFSFTVERNPWDAVVSLFHWHHRDGLPDGLDGRAAFAAYVASPAVEEFATKQARIYRLQGEVAVDRVLRYEALADELASVWADLGLPGAPDLPHAKAGVRPPGSYRELYDDATRQRVAELFAAPVAELGYEF